MCLVIGCVCVCVCARRDVRRALKRFAPSAGRRRRRRQQKPLVASVALVPRLSSPFTNVRALQQQSDHTHTHTHTQSYRNPRQPGASVTRRTKKNTTQAARLKEEPTEPMSSSSYRKASPAAAKKPGAARTRATRVRDARRLTASARKRLDTQEEV
jgi:hypothetical protein